MADPESNKQIAANFLVALNESPEKAAELITEDFKWVMPHSSVELFPQLASRELKGVDGLRQLLSLDEEIYENGHHGTSDVHFMIAADDWVVLQQDFETVALGGVPYRNTYCFTIRIAGDKIAEIWQHVDTLHMKMVCKPDPN